MRKKIFRSKLFYCICVVAGIVFLVSTGLVVRFYRGKQNAEEEWQSQQAMIRKIQDLGTTKTLEILPLIDWNTSDDQLQGEAGVSYLIKTDTSTILFDVGFNQQQSDPSPLLQNMKQLGVSLDVIDTIVFSHNHPDHVGGMSWSRQKTFSLTSHQLDLTQKRVYTPIPMTYPGLTPIHAKAPTRIAEGVTTIGAIPNQLFFLGWTPEQALAVNVEGKGIVLIVGCGHQTVSKLLQRVDGLFDEPLYGVIGGLHYASTASRVVVAGIHVQRYIGTGKVPWDSITQEDIQDDINLLRQRNLGIVGLSAHDSCDASVEAFRQAFPDIYHEINVGKKIRINDI
ncbi:MAG: MBL fold metallo-hydrolase [Candidatus Odinarchaeota archaeon]